MDPSASFRRYYASRAQARGAWAMRDRENTALESGTYAADRESDKVGNNQVLVLGNSDFTVTDFPRFECSMRQVLRAGEALIPVCAA